MNRRMIVAVGSVAILGGALAVWQLKAQALATRSITPDSSAQTAVTSLELTRTHLQLTKQQADLSTKLTLLQASSQQAQASHAQTITEHETNQILLGTTSVSGPGIRLTVTGKLLTASQLIDLVNALRNLGAEAISVNTQRFTGTSWVDEGGIAAPVTVAAIGSQRLLDSGVRQRGGILDELGVSATVDDVDTLTLPAR